MPRSDRPSAVPTMFCSAMNISKNRSGYFAWNISRIGRVAHFAVQHDHGREAGEDPLERRAVGMAGGHGLVRSDRKRARTAEGFSSSGLAVLRFRDRCLARSCRHGPSSSRAGARSSFLSGLPCQPFLSSMKETPLPLSVFAMIMTGRSFACSACLKAVWICGRWCPSITIGFPSECRDPVLCTPTDRGRTWSRPAGPAGSRR